MAKDHDERDLNFMSSTAVTPKFKMRWFPNEGRYIELESCKQI